MTKAEFYAKRFRDKRTGEIVTGFNILDIEYMEELDGEN